MISDRGASVPRGSRGRLVLVLLLAVVALITVAGGAVGVVLGAVTGPEVAPVAVPSSSEYRFLSGVWLVLGLLMWWSLLRPGPRAGVTRVVLICGIGGGIGRMVSLVVDGWPGAFVVALGVELVLLPVLLSCHLRTFRDSPGRE